MKRTILIIAIVFSFSQFLFSQDIPLFNLEENKEIWRFEIRPSFTLIDLDLEAATMEKGGYGYSILIKYSVVQRPKYQLQIGLGYDRFKFSFTDLTPEFSCDIDANGKLDPENSKIEFGMKLNYLILPVENRIKIGGNKDAIYAKTDIEFLALLSQNTSRKMYRCREPRRTTGIGISGIQFIIIMLDLGAGYEFPINDKLSLYFEPDIKISLNKFKFETLYSTFSLPNEFSTRFINIGFSVGVRF